MASKTTYIPRFLLPQNGPMWRAAAIRSAAFARPLNLEVTQVIVRYASTKGSAASKAAKLSAPTKPLPRTAAKQAVGIPASKVAAPPKPAVASKAAAPAPASAPTSAAAAASEPIVRAARPKPVAIEPSKPSKPIVLEKPERFNPPSHGKRLPRSTPRHYGGSLTAEEVQAQSQKTYPGLPPPPNTWSHWFINKRGIHTFITLGTLLSLAFYTFCANFNANSPFANMIPPISEFPRHPFQYVGMCIEVLKLHEEHESALTAEKRRKKIEDVAKRNEYRKAHGMEPVTKGWFGSATVVPEGVPRTGVGAGADAAVVDDASPKRDELAEAEVPPAPDGGATEATKKKFWGMF
ncbi:hypothetical protein F4808DRAFT_249003 [Astrocystis sublimbata]|nr:hypothetical protein F4808DRAFT_249003 [Astrocystis sublimbata]